MYPQTHRPVGPDGIHPQAYNNGAPGPGHPPPHGPSLPPFSSIESMGPPRSQPTNVSSMRYNAADAGGQRGQPTGTKRAAPPSSTVTSADSSEVEEEGGELPASGLVAPWEVLRGLADVAIERAAKVCERKCSSSHDCPLTWALLLVQENGGESEAPSRARTTSPEPRQTRPAKRRKVYHAPPRSTTFPDGNETRSLDLSSSFSMMSSPQW